MKRIIITLLYIFAVVNFVQANDLQHEHNSENQQHMHTENCESEECNHNHETHDHQNEEMTTDHDLHDHEAGDHDHEHEGEDHEHEGTEHNHTAEIENLHTITIKPATFVKTISTTGEIKVLPNSETIITASSSGIISFVKSELLVGSNVTKNENIFTISANNIVDDNLDVTYVEAKNNFQQSMEDYNRAKALVAENIISQKEFLNRKSIYQADSTRYIKLKNNYNSKALTVQSPIDGKIFELLVQNGDYVNTGDKLAVVSKSCNNYLEVNVPKQYYSQLSQINSGKFRTEFCKELHSFDEHEKISISTRAQVGSPYIPMNFSLGHNHELLPGSFVEVWLDVDNSPNSVVVPKSAIIEQQGLYFVFVKHADGDYLKTPVTIEAMNATQAKIASGIHVGEEVVVSGVVELKLSQSTSAVDPHAGHNH